MNHDFWPNTLAEDFIFQLGYPFLLSNDQKTREEGVRYVTESLNATISLLFDKDFQAEEYAKHLFEAGSIYVPFDGKWYSVRTMKKLQDYYRKWRFKHPGLCKVDFIMRLSKPEGLTVTTADDLETVRDYEFLASRRAEPHEARARLRRVRKNLPNYPTFFPGVMM